MQMLTGTKNKQQGVVGTVTKTHMPFLDGTTGMRLHPVTAGRMWTWGRQVVQLFVE